MSEWIAYVPEHRSKALLAGTNSKLHTYCSVQCSWRLLTRSRDTRHSQTPDFNTLLIGYIYPLLRNRIRILAYFSSFTKESQSISIMAENAGEMPPKKRRSRVSFLQLHHDEVVELHNRGLGPTAIAAALTAQYNLPEGALTSKQVSDRKRYLIKEKRLENVKIVKTGRRQAFNGNTNYPKRRMYSLFVFIIQIEDFTELCCV